MCVMQGTTKEIGGCAIHKKTVFLVCCTYYVNIKKFSHSSCIIGKH